MRDVQAVLLATTRLLKSHEDASAENILHKFMWVNTYQDVCLERLWAGGCKVVKSLKASKTVAIALVVHHELCDLSFLDHGSFTVIIVLVARLISCALYLHVSG